MESNSVIINGDLGDKQRNAVKYIRRIHQMNIVNKIRELENGREMEGKYMINEIARPFLIGASGCDIVVDEL